MSSDAPNPEAPSTPGASPAQVRLNRTLRACDFALTGLWLALAAFGVWAVAGELYFHVDSPGWTTMWESGPLQVGIDAFQGRGIYNDWTRGPVHLAIYGPLYHAMLAVFAWAAGGQPDALTASARWLSIVAIGIAMLGVVRFVRQAGASVAAAMISLVCLLLLTPTQVRFLASARPDGLAVMFSVLALVAGFGSGRISAATSIVLLTAAWQTKMSSVAACIAIVVVLACTGRLRRAAWIGGGVLTANALTLAVLAGATDGWALRHLLAPSAAPWKLEYLSLMLTGQPGFELPLLIALPLLAILISIRPGLPPLLDEARARGAIVYLLAGWLVALGTGLHQGSDRNYLIEPTLATGMVIGIFAGRLGASRETATGSTSWMPRMVAAIALVCCVVLLMPYRTRRFDMDAREVREAQNAYTPESLAWARQLPQPLLSVDSWLTYRAGVPNDLNDSIAYVGLLNKSSHDLIAERAGRGDYAAVLVFDLIENAGGIWGDIPKTWPSLRDSVRARYVLAERRGPWAVYTPER